MNRHAVPRAMGMSQTVHRATGQDMEHWFRLLDAWGEADHAARARRLQDETDVTPWWCQGIVVAYEQARGMRVAGQTSRGDFQSSVQRTLPAAPGTVWQALMATPWLAPSATWREGASFREADGAVVAVRSVRPGARIRFWRDVPDRRIVEVTLTPSGARTTLRCTESRLASLDERDASRARWRRALDAVEAALG